MPTAASKKGPIIAFAGGKCYRCSGATNLIAAVAAIAGKPQLGGRISVYQDHSALFSAAYPRQIYALIKDLAPEVAARLEKASANNPKEWFKALLREAIPIADKPPAKLTPDKERLMPKKDAAVEKLPVTWAPGPKKAHEGTKLPPQALAILAEVLAAGGPQTLEELCKKLHGKLKTKQPAASVVAYYQAKLIKLGLVTVA